MDFLHYVEIAQEYVDEIKAGAGGSSQGEATEILDSINGFAEIAKFIAETCVKIFNAVKAWLGK